MIKKGQITVFIIIGMVAVASGALIYFIYPNIKITGFATDPAYILVKDCLEDSVVGSASLFGYQQGYHTPPARYLDTGITEIAYYYFEGDVIFPRKDFFEKELSKIIDEQISKRCSDLEGQDYRIEFGKSSNNLEILEEVISVGVDLPIKIIRVDEIKEYSKFSYKIPIRLGHIIDVSAVLVEEIKSNPSSLDLTLLLNQDVEISIEEYDSCNQIYTILDPESGPIENEEVYVYSFAVKLEDEICNIV